MSVFTVMMIIAVVCWFLAAVPLPWTSPINMVALGLFFAGLGVVIGK